MAFMPEISETAMVTAAVAHDHCLVLVKIACGDLSLSQGRVGTLYLVSTQLAISVGHAGKPAGVCWIWKPSLLRRQGRLTGRSGSRASHKAQPCLQAANPLILQDDKRKTDMEGVGASPDPYAAIALSKVGSSVLRGDIVQQLLCQDVPTWRALSNACLARVYFQLAHRL